MNENKNQTMLIRSDIHHDFKIFCALNKLQMKKVVEKLITDYINEKGVKTDTLPKE